jgi:transcriptional regulator with XRE-family HTH domain
MDDNQTLFAMKLFTEKTNALKMPHPERRLLVASRMRNLRENSGLSQRHVASTLHVSQATYCRMERGDSEPSAVQLATLSGLYGISVLWMLGMPNFVVNAAQSSSSSS